MNRQSAPPRHRSAFALIHRWKRSTSGASAVEFAVIGPLFITLLFGIMSYGGYFWLAHAVQQLANDSARAAIAGLNASERQQLAQSTINVEMQNYSFLNPASAVVTVNSSQADAMTVSIAYDASSMPFWTLDKLIPMPPSTITRAATIKLAGY